jgi:hypothetical protein
MSAVKLASFGQYRIGACGQVGGLGGFAAGRCIPAPRDLRKTVAFVEAACLGRGTCWVTPDWRKLGDPCHGFRKTLAVEVVCGHRISHGDCSELRRVSALYPVVTVLSLARSAASTFTESLAHEMGAQYMDEMFNPLVSLSDFAGGHVFQNTRARPAALLAEVLRVLKRPVAFKLNDPRMLQGVLGEFSRCVNWCPIVLERAKVRDRWCSWVKASKTGIWNKVNKRKMIGVKVACPDESMGTSFRQFAFAHLSWYRFLRHVLQGNAIPVSFEQATRSVTQTQQNVQRFCLQLQRHQLIDGSGDER